MTQLAEEDLIEIINLVKPLEYNQYMLQNNFDLYDKTLEEFSQYIEHLETSVKTKWITMDGIFEALRKAQIKLKLPEFILPKRSNGSCMSMKQRTQQKHNTT